MGGGWGWHIVGCGWILGVRLVVGLGVVGGCRLVSGLRFGLLLMADKQCLNRFFWIGLGLLCGVEVAWTDGLIAFVPSCRTGLSIVSTLGLVVVLRQN